MFIVFLVFRCCLCSFSFYLIWFQFELLISWANLLSIWMTNFIIIISIVNLGYENYEFETILVINFIWKIIFQNFWIKWMNELYIKGIKTKEYQERSCLNKFYYIRNWKNKMQIANSNYSILSNVLSFFTFDFILLFSLCSFHLIWNFLLLYFLFIQFWFWFYFIYLFVP